MSAKKIPSLFELHALLHMIMMVVYLNVYECLRLCVCVQTYTSKVSSLLPSLLFCSLSFPCCQFAGLFSRRAIMDFLPFRHFQSFCPPKKDRNHSENGERN